MEYAKAFLDASFMIAFFNKKDVHHHQALSRFSALSETAELWTTDLVLAEIGNALSRGNREVAARFIGHCLEAENLKVFYGDEESFAEALSLYRKREDKDWGLTDCLSFVLMKREEIVFAFTADLHFVQAGFQIALSSQ